MGKLQEVDRSDVKREVVSASANLEVISHESFVRRLEGMSSACANCQRERTRSQRNKQGRKGKAARRKQQQLQQQQQQQYSKSNAPIVIHLKETMRCTGKHRHWNLDGDSDVSTRCSTDEEQYTSSSSCSSSGGEFHLEPAFPMSDYKFPTVYGDVASIPEFVPQYSSRHAWPQTLYHHVSQASASYYTSHPSHKFAHDQFHSAAASQKAKYRSKNNLTALISVIEKAHRKEPKDIEPNLSTNSPEGKLDSVLNNVSKNVSVSPQNDPELKRRNMAECDNVELICNDLSTAGEKLAESTDESDTSDKASVVSSSDTLSDDVADVPMLDEVKGHEFTPDELEQLAEYTTGVPLVRYDCPPSQCPECVNAWYTHQYFQYEGCNMYTGQRASSANGHDSQHYQHEQQEHESPTCRPEKGQGKATSPRSSVSSDSDISSDVEGSTSSISSSLSSSSSSSSPSSSSPSSPCPTSTTTTTAATTTHKTATASVAESSNGGKRTSRNSRSTWPRHSKKTPGGHRQAWGHHLEHCPQEGSPTQTQQVKRATASWKCAATRQLWDIDVAKASRRAQRRGCGALPDSVYMDLTGLDVTFTVMYHHNHPPHSTRGHGATWPYPVYSLYQAMYSPDLPSSPSEGFFKFPFRFNNTVFYPHKFDITDGDCKRYEMSLPPSRPWITTGCPDKDVPAAVFTVMCYNVLCDKLCTKAMYAYCPTWALSWDYRKKGIMNDILRGNGDIITLQEVETEQYYSMFLPELAQLGYDGIFLPKSRVRTMNSDKEKKCVDGCAIFFKKNKFEKVNEYQIEFGQLATKEGASNTDTDMINRVSTKDNIAIVAVLRTKAAVYENSPTPPPKGLTQMLMVSTAHIHWDPQSPDVKLVQTMMLIEELQKFVREASMQFRPNAPPPSLDAADLCHSMPLILCGDFNSLPDSGVYEFLSKGRLDTKHRDFEGQNYQVFMKDRNSNGVISHNFNLTSAYKDVIPFTNYTFDFKGIIDYIFYSDQHLRLHGVMGLQDEEWFRANKIVGCPHPFVPSDHFPLFAEFSLPAPPQRPR